MRSSSDTSLRLPIYTPLLKVPANNGELETLCLSRSDVEQWLQEWDIFGEERSQFLKSIVDAFIQSDQPETAYHHTLSNVSLLPSSWAESQSAAIDAIALALRLPSLFDFDPLFKLDAVVSAKDHGLFSLLQLESHPAALEKYELDRAQLEQVSSILRIESSQIEKWAIDVSSSWKDHTISTRLPRTLEREQWEAPESVLLRGRRA
ncbi:uncharacterized protein F5891DRAFT_975617 [Suillus fuscotomentosus]|uniref:Uncharacterized protein n=1 Tax=Suillus fuscotomentosus TaxID=1912939 RepID=A0AAD4EJK8_9AGAM|nr:uncharacterized protein F5891DRAFT_975617 [Suillus fuscotomentosus]KAG1906184.1 hypothetical protein F5891DRAFT_975617 [Suillus fuscotomentosus]